MDSDSESLLDQDMNSSASSSRASTPTHHEDFHASCKRKREIERELKTYTDSIDHCQTTMESENESLHDHDMSSNTSSSRASTPSIPEHFHSACQRRKLIEQELKTYTDSIDHTEILMVILHPW
ncbi:hypothetical protein NPIL_101451 [Nephila pilipes]|uniref:Uncharacterized protein n=1 Tax=Nephila pilipes TaxID=299642 RepID=A0A8X6NQ54_NEPPI|nr:hypothetical protein NPIL_101451 [Nephila pilipes]